MKYFKTLVALLGLAAASSQAFGADVSARSRSYISSCGYYSNTTGEVEISYHNDSLDWGTIIELIYGFDGEVVTGGGGEVRREGVEWQNETRQVIYASSSFQWTATIYVPMNFRSSNRFYKGLDFSFRIIRPDGRIEFDNGGTSPWGFYKVEIKGDRQCIIDNSQMPKFVQTEISRIERF